MLKALLSCGLFDHLRSEPLREKMKKKFSLGAAVLQTPHLSLALNLSPLSVRLTILVGRLTVFDDINH